MATEVADMLDRAKDTLSRSLATIDRESTRISEQLTELAGVQPYDHKLGHKLGSHLAWVTGKVAETMSALRQLEKHDRAQAKTAEQRHKLVKDYIRALDPVRLADLRQLIDELGTARSVLT
jgi:hypothetical protein